MKAKLFLLAALWFGASGEICQAQEIGLGEWEVDVLPGQTFDTREAALSALRAIGEEYTLAEVVEDVVITDRSAAYTYSARNRQPLIGEWENYCISNGNCPYTNEEAAIAGTLAGYGYDVAGCPPAYLSPQGPFTTSGVWDASNIANLESRLYDFNRYWGPEYSCEQSKFTVQGFRTRSIECPAYMFWDTTDEACVRKRIATITGQPQVCSAANVGNPCDTATGSKSHSEVDIDLPWISVGRSYHSLSRSPGEVFGTGWSSTLSSRLAISPYYSKPNLIDRNGLHVPMREADYPGSGATTYEAVDGSGLRAHKVDGKWIFNRLDGSTDTFSASSGLWERSEREDGSSLIASYDQAMRLSQVSHSSGRVLTVFYNAVGLVDLIEADGVSSVDFVYDANHNLVSAVKADGTSRTYHYENAAFPSHLTGITDENGTRYATYEYDGYGRVVLSEHSGGAGRVTLNYNTDGTTDVVMPLGELRRYHFSGGTQFRKLTQLETSSGVESKTLEVADYRRRILASMDRGGSETLYTYQDGGDIRTTTLTEGLGTPSQRTIETDTDLAIGRTVEVRHLSKTTSYVYNDRRQLLTSVQIDPSTSTSRATSITYCEQSNITAGTCPLLGLVTAINGPRTDVSDIITYTYRMADAASCASAPATCAYRKGDLWKTTNALGQVTEILSYDGAGRVLSVKDPNGVITDSEYHPRGWLTARKVRGTNNAVETDDQITSVEYWPTGLVKKVTQPDGAFTSYTYDAAHRLTDIADNAGNTIHYTLDNAGNRIQEDTKDAGSALKRTLSRVYNQLGQLATQADANAAPTDFTYDANGNTDTVTDALNRVTDNDYDPLNRLARTLQDVGGIEAETAFAYDALDNLTQVTDPKGLNTTYGYNGFSDLTQLVSPDTGTTSYTYDSAGNRKTQTDARNKLSTYSYDVLNRLTGITYATSSLNVVYTYDVTQGVCAAGETFSKGQLTKMADGSGTTQYCFDRFGHLVRKVQISNGKTFTLRYTYTKAGQLSSTLYPDGALVDYVRDGQGRVTEVGATAAGGVRQVLLHQAAYYPFGPVAGWSYGNARSFQRTLNQNYQPETVFDGGSGGLSLGYEFDAAGNLSKLKDGLQSAVLAQYDYDALNRLTDTKDGPTGTVIEHYGYDDTGNRTSMTNAGGTAAYTYPGTSHRLTKVGTVNRSYDAAGNTTQIGGTARQFVYDATGRMSQVKAGSTVTRNYKYNGRGEQVRRYLGTANTYTLYDEAGHWLGDYDSTGAVIQQAIWLDDLPVGLLVGAGTSQKLHYIEPDALGTPRVVIDPVRNVAVWKWELVGEAFGTTVPNQDPDLDATGFVLDMRFPGQRYDAASGLNYNYFRDYDASTGRYVESDPIGLRGGANTFAYVRSNSFNGIDPLGLAEKCKQHWRFGKSREGPDDRINGADGSSTNCTFLPVAAPPSPIDFFPDPIAYSRGRFPFGMPYELWRLCIDVYYQRTKVMGSTIEVTEYFDVCTDDCGNVTIKAPHRSIENIRWRFKYNEDNFWSVFRLQTPRGTMTWPGTTMTSNW